MQLYDYLWELFMGDYIWEIIQMLGCLTVIFFAILGILHIICAVYCFVRRYYVVAAIIGLLLLLFGD